MKDGYCTQCGRQRGVRKPDSMALPLGTRLDDGSVILGEAIGEGGFGITYSGYDERKGRRVCIKEFLPKRMVLPERKNCAVTIFGGMEERYEHALRGFVREAKIINELQAHPNITKVYFYFEENNTAYYGMELLRGQNLKQWLRQLGRPLTIREICQILNPIMDALSFSHAHKVLHRDISPDNVFLCNASDGPERMEPKLIDYGAAYAAIASFTQTYELVQKAGYTPIEQLLYGKEAQGPWVDIYAFCATVYYCLTLEVPAPAQLIHRGDKPAIASPSRLGIKIPRRAEQALMGGLEMRYEDRRKKVPSMSYLQMELCEACGIAPYHYTPAPALPETVIEGQASFTDTSVSRMETAHATKRMTGILQCNAGACEGMCWTLRDKSLIGRHSGSVDIVVDDLSVSRRHCSVEQYGKGFVITDLGSANGTYVNGKKIPPNQPVWLKNGMIVKIGMNTFKLAEREE